jgi:hypothetical protein
MRCDRRQALLAVLVLGLMAAPAAAQKKEPAPKKEKPPTYLIMQIDDEFEVIDAKEYTSRTKEIAQKFKEDSKSWSERSLEAKREKQKFDEPKPKQPKTKKLPGTYTSREDADKAREKAKEDHDKMKSKKPGAAS